jgi:hypothetical protein
VFAISHGSSKLAAAIRSNASSSAGVVSLKARSLAGPTWGGVPALFTSAPAWGSTVPEHVYQLQLRTGAITGFTLPARVTAVGYTRPDGLNILAEEGTPTSLDSKITLLRYNLAGQLQKALATVTGLGQVAY